MTNLNFTFKSDSTERRLRIGNAVAAFPPTRSGPPQIPRLTVLQHAEQGVRLVLYFVFSFSVI